MFRFVNTTKEFEGILSFDKEDVWREKILQAITENETKEDETTKDKTKKDDRKDDVTTKDETTKDETKVETTKDETRKDKTTKDETTKDETMEIETTKDKARKYETTKDRTIKIETTKDETRKDETIKDETKKDKTTKDETTRDETIEIETTKDEAKKYETTKGKTIKIEKTKETRKDERIKNETRKDKTTKDETRKDKTTKDETGKDETTKDETTKDETKKDETIKDETTNEETRKDASVVDFYTFQKPLAGRALNCLRNCTLPGENHYLQHQYFVAILKKMDGEECFLSLDKAPDGITAQYGLTYKSVVSKFKGKMRYKPLPELQRSFNPFTFVILPNVSTVLRNLEEIVKYDLWNCNCQTLTQELVDRLSKSDKIELHVPGTDKKVGLNDDGLISFVENMYPSWKGSNGDENLLYGLTRIPKVGDITIHSDDPGMKATVEDNGVLVEDSNKKSDYDSLVDRQKFYNRVCNNRIVMGKEGLLKNERHVIMNNLEPNKYTKVIEALKVGNTEENNKNKMYAIEMVSGIWKQVFDILVITEKHGVVLFQFAAEGLGNKKAKKKKDKEEIKLKAEMLRKLVDFGGCTFLTTVLVKMHGSKNRNPKFKKKSYGGHFDLTVSTLKREDGELVSGDTIDERITTIFTEIRKDIPDSIKKNKLENKLNMLVGNIFLLQNMEDDHHLLHHKITSQEWGRPGVMLWTPKQWECIEMAKDYFRPEKSEKLKLLVRGCPGSGKTLILMRIAREFVAANKEQKVFVFIDNIFKMLMKYLTDIIANDIVLRDRVIVYDTSDVLNRKMHCEEREIGLLLHDEASEYVYDLREMDSTQYHSVVFTSFDVPIDDYHNNVITLDGNLRSSTSISNKILEFQKVLKDDDSVLTIDVTSKLKLENLPEPVVYNFEYGLYQRENILKIVLEIIDQTREKVGEKEDIIVSCECYKDLRKKILSECKTSGVYFHSPDEMLGCQFSTVILVWEPESGLRSRRTIINVITRCITNLTVVLNNPFSAIIHGIPTIAHYSGPDISLFAKWLKEIDVKKVLVIYDDEIDPEECGDDAKHVRDFIRVIDKSPKFTSQVGVVEGENELRRPKSAYQFVVYVIGPTNYPSIYPIGLQVFEEISLSSTVPVLQVVITPRDETYCMMERLDKVKNLTSLGHTV